MSLPGSWLLFAGHRLLLISLLLSELPASMSVAQQTADSQIRVIHRKDGISLSPVIFVPGVGGSQLYAKLDKPEVVHESCTKKTDNMIVWRSPEQMRWSISVDCYIDNTILDYDDERHITHDKPGVTINVPGWGNSEVVEWPDPTHASDGGYFNDIGDALVAIGYVRNVSLRGAPYDFRKGPNENGAWFEQLKKLVVETYAMNNDQPITFVAHSMGGPMTLCFLTSQSVGWKEKYVARFISLASPWGGTVKALKMYAMGDNLGISGLSSAQMRLQQISHPSLAWLLPSPKFWRSDEILVAAPKKRYRMENLHEYFNDLQYPDAWEMHKDNLIFTNLRPPAVEAHCLFGFDIPTVEWLNYSNHTVNAHTPPVQMMGDGDGTVNYRSLRGCLNWEGMDEMFGKNVTLVELPKVDHRQVLSDSRVIKYVLDTVLHN